MKGEKDMKANISKAYFILVLFIFCTPNDAFTQSKLRLKQHGVAPYRAFGGVDADSFLFSLFIDILRVEGSINANNNKDSFYLMIDMERNPYDHISHGYAGDDQDIPCDYIVTNDKEKSIEKLEKLFQNAAIPCLLLPNVPRDRHTRKWCTPLRKNWVEIHKPIFGWEVMNAFWGGDVGENGTFLYLPIVTCRYRGEDTLLYYRYNVYKIKLWVSPDADEGIYFYKLINKDNWWW